MEIVELPKPGPYEEPNPGVFGSVYVSRFTTWLGETPKTIDQDTVDWHHCRETFHRSFKADRKHILFCTSKPEVVEWALNKVQDHLKLPQADRLTFHETNRKNVMAIKVSRWWRVSHRRSLLTILIRTAHLQLEKVKKTTTVKELLELMGRKQYETARAANNKYFRGGSKTAIKEFMKGRTKFTGKMDWKRGWVSVFNKADTERVKELLVKPEKKQKV